MNVFYLHPDPSECALLHCDIHVNKMIIESCQLLSTAVRLKYGEPCRVTKIGDSKAKSWLRLPSDKIQSGFLLKWGVMAVSHKNHPCAVWVRESEANFKWLWALTLHLNDVWRHNMGRRNHSCVIRMISDPVFSQHCDDVYLTTDKWTQPAQAMPDQFKTSDVVTNYRNYYRHKLSEWRSDPHKVDYANYTNRPTPEWLGV